VPTRPGISRSPTLCNAQHAYEVTRRRGILVLSSRSVARDRFNEQIVTAHAERDSERALVRCNADEPISPCSRTDESAGAPLTERDRRSVGDWYGNRETRAHTSRKVGVVCVPRRQAHPHEGRVRHAGVRPRVSRRARRCVRPLGTFGSSLAGVALCAVRAETRQRLSEAV
jgi:hypothetical protein